MSDLKLVISPAFRGIFKILFKLMCTIIVFHIGIIDFLCGGNLEAELLRDNIVFKIGNVSQSRI